MQRGVFGTLLSGMGYGYRRWMSLFNILSIVLSVTLALVILSFAFGMRTAIGEMVRKEAAAGSVRVHLSGWRPESWDDAFGGNMRRAHERLREELGENAYRSYHFWWRSEAHFLMPTHPAEQVGRGIYTKLGNTIPDDPEAERVRPYLRAGRWIKDRQAEEIVLSTPAALKLIRMLPDVDRMEGPHRSRYLDYPPAHAGSSPCRLCPGPRGRHL